MNVLFHIHAYVPHHNAGSEVMARDIVRHLRAAGHTVQVVTNTVEEYIHEGVRVTPTHKHSEVDEAWKQADVVVTHLQQTGDAINRARKFDKPIVHIIHTFNKVTAIVPDKTKRLIVYNAQHIQDLHEGRGGYGCPHIICRPLIDPEAYRVERTGEHIVLVNLNENKGGWVFVEVAARMQDLPFLGIAGAYGRQVMQIRGRAIQMTKPRIDGSMRVPHNVKYLPQRADMREVYRQAKVVLMMSGYETWGRVASEAMVSGIPVISTRTYGIQEQCGDSVRYVDDKGDFRQWERAIREVLADYDAWSGRAKARAMEVNGAGDYVALVAAIENHANLAPKVKAKAKRYAP